MNRVIVLSLDEQDYKVIRRELSLRIARIGAGCVGPVGSSNFTGALLAEAIRDLEEYRDLYSHVADQAGEPAEVQHD